MSVPPKRSNGQSTRETDASEPRSAPCRRPSTLRGAVSSADQAAEPFRFDRWPPRRCLLVRRSASLVVDGATSAPLSSPTLVNHHPGAARSRSSPATGTSCSSSRPASTALPFFVDRLLPAARRPTRCSSSSAAGTASRRCSWLEAKAGDGCDDAAPLDRAQASRRVRLPARRDHAATTRLPLRRHRRACGPARSGRSTCSASIGRLVVLLVPRQGVATSRSTTFLDWVAALPVAARSRSPSCIVMVQAFRAQGRGEIEPISEIEDEIEALDRSSPPSRRDAADRPTSTIADDGNRVADDENTDVR